MKWLVTELAALKLSVNSCYQKLVEIVEKLTSKFEV